MTADDVAVLNRTVVSRSAVFARFAGVALIVVGAFGVVAWIGFAVRQQQVGYGQIYFPDFDAPEMTLGTRVTVFASEVWQVMIPVAVIGFGFFLRLAADYTQVRVGASVTGYEVGDRFPPDLDE